MKKRINNLYLLLFFVIFLLSIAVIPTYAKFASNYTTEDDVVGLALDFTINITNIEEYNDITVAAGSYETFNVDITNDTGVTAYYGVWYNIAENNDIANAVSIGRLEGTTTTTSGNIEAKATKTVSIIVINNSDSAATVEIGIGSSTTSAGDIEYLDGKRLIKGTLKTPANHPNLDGGNLIPVYYDDTAEVWKKADSGNQNNSWYDYDNKMWANAILISDSTKRTTYQRASVGTTITDSDITAFYVWIPRYKYRVWDITRQIGGPKETDYSYLAYTYGIDIEWEKDTESTGNVECTYNTAVTESDTNLSDTCVYNGTDTITTTSGNANYTDAWYTHPAFTFGNKEIEGFWIGKFETTGTYSAPTILPDEKGISATVSAMFTSSKVFQTYGLSNNIDAHMLTNLEWGAVAYLTHSIYGLCNGTSCRDVYINNSSSWYTGRSGGEIAGSEALNLTNVYPNDTTSTNKYKPSGYYTYKGYFIDYNDNVTTTKDTTKVASTTGNITGIYDMSGGMHDYVMGNMVDNSNAFYPSSAGTNWNGSSTLDTKYYNSYSYGTGGITRAAFNRARLGDATAEVTGIYSSSTSTWKPGSSISAADSGFINNANSWFMRGGISQGNSSGIFSFLPGSGVPSILTYTFRSSLS